VPFVCLTGAIQDAMEGDVDCCPRDHARAECLLETLRQAPLRRKKKNPLAAANATRIKAAVRELELTANCLVCRPLRGQMLPAATVLDTPTAALIAAPTVAQTAPDSLMSTVAHLLSCVLFIRKCWNSHHTRL
jgi:hypothetical protein